MIQRQKWPPAATMLDAEQGGGNRRSLLALSTAQGEWRKARLTLLGARGERRQRRLRALQRAPNAARRLARVEATHALQASRDRLTRSLGRGKQSDRERESGWNGRAPCAQGDCDGVQKMRSVGGRGVHHDRLYGNQGRRRHRGAFCRCVAQVLKHSRPRSDVERRPQGDERTTTTTTCLDFGELVLGGSLFFLV